MEINSLLTEYINLALSGTEDKTERFTYLYFRMNKVISDIVGRLRGEFSESDFEPCDFELNIGVDGDVPPFTVELDEGTVIFCGKIDRVDKLDADGKRYIRIVDYKTGSKDFVLNDVLNGMNMQMLLYLVSIWRNGRGEYENITPAGVLYYPAKIEPLKVDREADEETRLRKRLMNTKMKGLLVEDEQIIRRMDKKGEGLFLPVSFDKKTGELKGNLISLTALGRLAEKMDAIIKDMGDSLQSGRVDARPLMGGGHTNTCLYCDYKEVCMLKKPTYRYIESLKHNECIEMLMKEGEQ
jgi:ATP-dependent helicase/nuclease subunit B